MFLWSPNIANSDLLWLCMYLSATVAEGHNNYVLILMVELTQLYGHRKSSLLIIL